MSKDNKRDKSSISAEEKLDNCIASLGGFSYFQLFAYYSITLGLNSVGFWLYSISFLYQEPTYKCWFSPTFTGNPTDYCTAERICANDPLISAWDYDFTDPNTLDNWHQKLNLMCEPKSKIAMLGSAFFFGWASTLLWLPRVGDIYGRRLPFAINSLVCVALYSAVMVTKNLNVMIFLIFLFGTVSSIRIQVGFNYLLELVPKPNQTMVATLWNCTEGLIYLVVVIYFYYVSKDWQYIIGWGYCL
jgi:MFS family permease